MLLTTSATPSGSITRTKPPRSEPAAAPHLAKKKPVSPITLALPCSKPVSVPKAQPKRPPAAAPINAPTAAQPSATVGVLAMVPNLVSMVCNGVRFLVGCVSWLLLRAGDIQRQIEPEH